MDSGYRINELQSPAAATSPLSPILFPSQSEREEFEADFKEKYERERTHLTEENKKLSSELDKVKYLFRYAQNNENTYI